MNPLFLNLPFRVRAKIKIGLKEECWPWLGCIQWAGHGQVHWHGKTYSVHRLVYETIKGAIPKELEVMHTCNNASCQNPEHLVLGTHAENQHYMSVSKRAGTKRVGESKIQGVIFSHGYWVARITVNKQRIQAYHGSDFFEACCVRKSFESRNS